MTSYQPHDGEQKQSSAGPFSLEKESEAARLLLQYRQVSELMGGALSPMIDLAWGSRVLDVGCGVGGWVYEMAWRHSSLRISGIDSSTYLIEKAQALVEGLDNVTVFAHDIFQLDDEVFSPGTFDLIHMGFLAREVTPKQFPPLIQSLVRICRPGGFIVWTEAELPISNSFACQHLCALVQSGLKAAGRAFTPGNCLGVTAYMGHWLGNAKCHISQDTAYAIEVSTGTKGHDAFVLQMRAFGEQVKPFLLEMGVTTAAELEDILQEIQQEGFCGIVFLRTVVAVK